MNLKITSFLRVALVALWTTFWTVLALLIHLVTRKHEVPLTLAHRIWAPGALRLMGAKLDVAGLARLDHKHPYLFVANHTSQLDIPVLFASVPVLLRFLAKEELRRFPLVSQFISAMGMIFIDRSRSNAARKSIDSMAASLEEGMSLMAFPEGTRSRDGELQSFKTGAFVAAIKSGVAVVPILIEGAAAVLPAGSLAIQPGRVRVVAGRPVSTQGLIVDDRRRLADLVRTRMLELKEKDSAPE